MIVLDLLTPGDRCNNFMAYQSFSSGCGCNTPARQPMAAPRPKRAHGSAPCDVQAPVAEPCPCYTKEGDGSCSTLTLTQGESLSGEKVICSGRPIGPLTCFLPPNQISFSTPNCLKVGDTFSVWCSPGCSDDLADLAFEVIALSADRLTVTFSPDLPASVSKICYTRGSAVIGCPGPSSVPPAPEVFLLRDLSEVQFVGAVWTHDGESDSRIDSGLTVTDDPSVVSSYYQVLTEGDRVCIPSVGITDAATVLRVWSVDTYCGDEIVEVWHAKLSKSATSTSVCGPAHIEHGTLINFDFELLDNGCVSVELRSGQTAAIPLRSGDAFTAECGTTAYAVGKYQIFAITPYLTPAGQLRSRTQSVDRGNVIVYPTFAGQYGAC